MDRVLIVYAITVAFVTHGVYAQQEDATSKRTMKEAMDWFITMATEGKYWSEWSGRKRECDTREQEDNFWNISYRDAKMFLKRTDEVKRGTSFNSEVKEYINQECCVDSCTMEESSELCYL
ncbi:uncharacterized protein [Amphiura filiformis]|uniref:uncharacterized protein n=1 Tax=Amphiura filiformis TaxID=82378 RepID=UPI003B227832